MNVIGRQDEKSKKVILERVLHEHRVQPEVCDPFG